jgi:prolyl 4-hydroxylase
MLSIEARCPIDPDAPVVWKESGDLDNYFYNITTNSELRQLYDLQVLSKPHDLEADPTSTEIPEGPWLILFDNFLTDEESDRLIEVGGLEGYQRSSDVGTLKYDGTYENYVNNGRTSENAWCQHACYNDTLVQGVIDRITKKTIIPEVNSEYLQLLRFHEGQYYHTHHDLIEHQLDRQPGVRILTFYMYLNDVEEGGGTDFPRLSLTVKPKKGRAVLWPSVLNDNPNEKDQRTEHQALAVKKGVKYGATAWIHQRDFKGPNRNGCQ